MPGVRGKGVGKARGTESVTSLLAIRKSYRKEMLLTTKSEALANIYVIETEVVTEERGKKTEGSQNMRVHPD